ncbi:MAG: PspC domain-containing protein, partial [Bacteroidaceae bacterium]|nr:PspC domain-containing protein [Bacteroidaceae bacterium]
MKKNITINLCGRLYQIDEDAYELLSHYTDTLRDYFKKQEGGEETADDIEERIAELFDDLKSKGIQAITIEHVQGVIEQIGKVEEIAGENAEYAENAGSSANAENKKPLPTKKFFRDSQNKVLAGVLAGCANYFGGSANGWRWGFVLLSVLWIVFDGIFGTILGVMVLPIILVSIPFAFLPLLIYLLVAIFNPETKTAEDVLMMRGKEVNPQNLSEVVQGVDLSKEKKNGISFWDILLGVICVGLSTALTIGLIVALCFFVAFVVASESMADSWCNLYLTEDVDAIFIPAIVSGVLLLVSIAILLYCSIHAAASSFGKTPSMKGKQRLMWFILWIVSVVGFVGNTIYAVAQLAKTQTTRWDTEQAEWKKEHTHYGFVFNDDDWNFFQNGDWKLVKAEGIDRYTYNGEYMTGDLTRYLDACANHRPYTYEAEREVIVEPDIYRLSAAVRADNDESFIFVEEKDTTGQVSFFNESVQIPNYGTQIGNIWETIGLEQGFYSSDDPSYLNDPVLKELVGRLSKIDKDKIADANGSHGYGWSYVYIDN